MTPETQRIAIAEACGWKQRADKSWHWKDNHPEYPGELIWPEPPDYLNDLNAMHEAEKVLTPEQRVKYSVHLAGVLLIAGLDNDAHLLNPVFSTAAQRAEAFLRTKGLWKD